MFALFAPLLGGISLFASAGRMLLTGVGLSSVMEWFDGDEDDHGSAAFYVLRIIGLLAVVIGGMFAYWFYKTKIKKGRR